MSVSLVCVCACVYELVCARVHARLCPQYNIVLQVIMLVHICTCHINFGKPVVQNR